MSTLAQTVASYLPLLVAGDVDELVGLLDPDATVDEPMSGSASGPSLREMLTDRSVWLRARGASVLPVRSTSTGVRAIDESLVHLEAAADGPSAAVDVPFAVVGEPGASARLAGIRVYHSTWPLTAGHQVRPPLLPGDPAVELSDFVRDYHRALGAGDLAGIMAAFAPDGCAREPAGGEYVYCGVEALRAFYSMLFGNGGGIHLIHCTATDDGIACALEYTADQWGRTVMPPQAGVAVYERGSGGRLAWARIYDDVRPPI